MSILPFFGVFGVFLLLLLIAAPVMVGARWVGAGYTSFGRALLAIFVATLITGIATSLFHRSGTLVSLLADALAYMLILQTTYLRGLAVTLIQWALTALIVLVALSVALGSVAAGKNMLLHGGTPQVDAPSGDV